jgi:hypothetical protein
MFFNPIFTRTFLAVGILQEYLIKESHAILVGGKTALQLTAVLNDNKIMEVNRRHPPLQVYEGFTPGICVFTPCSDFDISLVSVEVATLSLQKTFVSSFLLFFNNSGTRIDNFESPDVPSATYERFRQTNNLFLASRSHGSPDTISVKKNVDGIILDVLDVKFKTQEQIDEIFLNLQPVFCEIDITPRSMLMPGSMMPRSMLMPGSMMPRSMLMPGSMMPGSMMPSSMLMPGSIPVSVLVFPLPNVSSFLNECIQITIKELTKLLKNKAIVGDDNYFFVITTLLKFFSRAVQLSYILVGETGQSTRSIFNSAVASFRPNQELQTIIKAILNLFLVDKY